jgi:hypothetical protein
VGTPSGDLDEVKPRSCAISSALRRGHDAQLGTFFIDHPDLWDPDHLVDRRSR